MESSVPPSPVVIAVLALLADQPLHPYKLQQIIKARAMDKVFNVRNRSGLYAAIDRLAKEDLIQQREVERNEHRQERTIYEATPLGRETLADWLRQMLATPAREFPAFPAAVTFLYRLAPEDVERQLTARLALLVREVADINSTIAEPNRPDIPRLHLLEWEYSRATKVAELTWIRAVLDDLRTGTLSWQPRY